MCVEEKEGEGGRLVLRCERAVAEDSVDNEDEPFEVIYRMNIKPQEGRTIFFSRWANRNCLFVAVVSYFLPMVAAASVVAAATSAAAIVVVAAAAVVAHAVAAIVCSGGAVAFVVTVVVALSVAVNVAAVFVVTANVIVHAALQFDFLLF